jgi:hypothetical protein
VTEVIPIRYLHGLSTGVFGPALRDLPGEVASRTVVKLDPAGDRAVPGRAPRVPHPRAAIPLLRLCPECGPELDFRGADGVHVSVCLGEDPKLCGWWRSASARTDSQRPGSLLTRAAAVRRVVRLHRAGVMDGQLDEHLDGIAPAGQ